MASAHVTTRSLLSSFLPRLSPATSSRTSKFATVYSRQLSLPLIPSLGFALPSAIQLNIPQLVEGIWESILRAVPKKKTSHMKKRHRQYAGKALKDVTALNKCSSCGMVKRAHYLCPYCVNEIKDMFKARSRSLREKMLKKVEGPTSVEEEVVSKELQVTSKAKPADSEEGDGAAKL